jgi:RNA polymerase sigma factor (sigma-70 family)
MPDHADYERCLRLVAGMSHEQQWQLDLLTLQRYAEQVVACFDQPGEVSDERLLRTIDNYHSDHVLVEALRAAEAHHSAAVWTEWSGIVLRILAHRLGAQPIGGDPVAHLDDLQQDALLDLWRGLPTFRYQSRFNTWATALVVNCAARRRRSIRASKRSMNQAQSIDAVTSAVDNLEDEQALQPEQAVLSDELARLVRQVLGAHPDHRLRVVFELWVVERQSMRAIGERLNLSPARVHALLHQAVALIRGRLHANGWFEQSEAGGSTAEAREAASREAGGPTEHSPSRRSHDSLS